MGSLRLRIFASMVVVAIVASVLAGLIVRRQTVEAVRDAAQSDFENDAFLAEELMFASLSVESWGELTDIVEDISDQTGSRVAVVGLDGTVLVDSDPGEPLPPQPSSVLDPLELGLSLGLDEVLVIRGEELFLDDFDAEPDEFDDDFPDESVGKLSSDPHVGLYEELEGELFDALPPTALLYLGYGVDDQINVGELDVTTLLLSSLLLIGLAGGLALVVANRVSGPVRRLTNAVDRLGAGDLSQRVAEGGGGEVGSLAASFNAMATDLESSESARANMVSDVAHELRNPVGVLQGSLEAAQDGLFNIDRELIDSLHDETLHLAHLVDDLQQLALADAGALVVRPETTDLTELVTQVAGSYQQAATDAGLQLSVEADGPVEAEVDRTRLHQVVSNLVANAIAYTPAGGSIRVNAFPQPGFAVISVADTGVGLSAEETPLVFDRFWRTDASRTRATGGTGVGLSICKELIESHGGTISVDSRVGVGSTFIVRLPQ